MVDNYCLFQITMVYSKSPYCFSHPWFSSKSRRCGHRDHGRLLRPRHRARGDRGIGRLVVQQLPCQSVDGDVVHVVNDGHMA